jgi:hypothetical protein
MCNLAITPLNQVIKASKYLPSAYLYGQTFDEITSMEFIGWNFSY